MAWWYAAAAVVQLYGQKKANDDQAEAERANAREYQAQKRLSEMAARREADIFLTESASFIGDQVSMLAKSGVQMDGSSLMEIAKSKSAADREYAAIQAGAASRASMFDMRARQAKNMANRISSSEFNNIQTLGTLLNVGGDFARSESRKNNYERQTYEDAESGSYSGPRGSFR